MGVENRKSRRKPDVRDQSGQSVLEFLLTLPLMVGLAVLMIRVNTVIQMGIVNQQYVRAQTLYVSDNAADYPQRPGFISVLASSQYNQLVVAMVEPQELAGDPATSPPATTYRIAPKTLNGFNNNDQTEAALRGVLRIRSTVTLCIPTLVSSSGTPVRPISLISPPGQAIGMSSDPAQFIFCHAPQSYVDDSGQVEQI
ncbi:MAG: hypothetical protein P4M08_08485 [Oligoflexia bacterium]|nr:hypothetical protein [Oligoflexia bacterium]